MRRSDAMNGKYVKQRIIMAYRAIESRQNQCVRPLPKVKTDSDRLPISCPVRTFECHSFLRVNNLRNCAVIHYPSMDVLDSGESLSIFTLSPANAVLRSRVRHAALPTSSSARRRVARWVPSRDLSQGSSTRLKLYCSSQTFGRTLRLSAPSSS